MTIGLVYSLIKQLVCKRLVPAEILDGPDFGPKRSEALDGTDASLEPAVSILDTLLNHAGPHLLCIIDGLNILDQAEGVLNMLKRHVQSGRPKVFKVLYTASGYSRALLDCTEFRERHLLDTDPHEGGQLLNSRRTLWTGDN